MFIYSYCLFALFCIFCFHRANWHSPTTLRFFRAFFSVVRQMPRYSSQRRGTVRTLPNYRIVLIHVLFVSIVSVYIFFQCKCVLYYCHRVATQLQLNLSYHIYLSENTSSAKGLQFSKY